MRDERGVKRRRQKSVLFARSRFGRSARPDRGTMRGPPAFGSASRAPIASSETENNNSRRIVPRAVDYNRSLCNPSVLLTRERVPLRAARRFEEKRSRRYASRTRIARGQSNADEIVARVFPPSPPVTLINYPVVTFHGISFLLYRELGLDELTRARARSWVHIN